MMQPWVDGVAQDVRGGWRAMRRSPGLTVLALVTLGLGIGANTAIFSVVDAVLIRTVPFPQADELVRVFQKPEGRDRTTVSPLNFLDWHTQSRSLDGMSAYRQIGTQIDLGTSSDRVLGLQASADLFAVLKAKPSIGRTFTPADDRPGAQRVAVLSHGLWQSAFGGDPGVVNRPILMDGERTIVIGVMPRGWHFPATDTAIWLPLRLGEDAGRFQRTENYLSVLARLAPGVSLQSAQQELDAVAANLARTHPTTNAGIGAEALRLTDHMTRHARPGLLLLQGAVLLVLLIGAANVANLLLARVTTRHRELALREALGAGRWRIARQLFLESTLLALVGGACGWFLAYAGFDLLLSLVPSSVPQLVPIRLDHSTLLFGLLLTLATGVIAGTAPVFARGRLDLVRALRDSSRVTTASRVRLTLGALVVVEVALVTVLVVATGLMVRSLTNLRHVDLGFNPDGLSTVDVTLSDPSLESPDDATEDRAMLQFQEILSRLRTIPAVEHAAAVSNFPLTGEYTNTRFVQQRRLPTDPAHVGAVDYSVVTPRYFRTMGIPLLEGRSFDDADTGHATPVAIINQAMAKRLWPGQSAVGQQIRRGGLDQSDFPWMTIVGVVGNIRHLSLDSAPVPELFIPHAQFAWPQMTVVVRTEHDTVPVVSSIRQAIHDLDKNHRVGSIGTAEQILGASVGGRQFAMRLLAAFAALALGLALVGIYGVVAYGVGQRTHEIGVRMALGARPLSILVLIVREVLFLSALGLTLGSVAAVVLGRTLRSFLYEISPVDGPTFVTTALILGAAGTIAAYLPSRRAASLDPVATLRNE